MKAPLCLKLMSALKKKPSITEANIVTLLDVLKENRNNYNVRFA
jgi:hypothetical protein